MFNFITRNLIAKRSILQLTAAIMALVMSNASANGSNDACKKMGAFIDPFVEMAMFDGVVMVELRGEKTTCRYGLSDYENSKPHADDTQFRIASVSKTITDAAVARLVERRELAMDDPIAQFLPAFPKADLITLRHLLEHTSGVAHTNSLSWGHARIPLTLDEIIERLAEEPFSFEPGEDRQYSNGGYALIAKILEQVTGESYGAAMHKLVFEPLGMKGSGHLADSRALMPRMAVGYEPGPTPGARRHTRFYAAELRPGGGSLYSTAEDLMLFMAVLEAGEFIAPELMSDIIGSAPDEVFESQGRSPGFVANVYNDPGRAVRVVSLSNNYSVPSFWSQTLADIVADGETDVQWAPINKSDKKVSQDHPMIGDYASNFGGEVSIKQRDGALYFRDTENQLRVAMPSLANEGFLLPIYFSLCRQDAKTRIIECEMLSGDTRYTQIYTPVSDQE